MPFFLYDSHSLFGKYYFGSTLPDQFTNRLMLSILCIKSFCDETNNSEEKGFTIDLKSPTLYTFLYNVADIFVNALNYGMLLFTDLTVTPKPDCPTRLRLDVFGHLI